MTHRSSFEWRTGVVALAIATPILYVFFAVLWVVHDHRMTTSLALSNVHNIASTLNEHATRTFGEADSHLRSVVGEIEQRGLSFSAGNDRALHDLLLSHLERIPQAATLNAVGADGFMRVTAAGFPIRPIDSRDREYYRFHTGNPDSGLFVARPIKSRATDKWTIPLTRRVRNADGSLRMIIVLGIDMGYFDRFYRDLELGNAGRLLLVRSDGPVLMETPLVERVLSMDLGGSDVFQHYRRMPAAAYRTRHSQIDDADRIVGFASSAEFPIIAVASESADEVLAPVRNRMWRIAALALASVAMLLTLLRMLRRRLDDLTRARLGLAVQNKELSASRQRYAELVEGIDGIVWEAELPAFRFTYVSAKAGPISGFPAEEWLANPRFWHEKLSVDDKARNFPALVLDAGNPASLEPIEHHVTTPDGRELWLRSNILLTRIDHGHLRVRGVTIDITQQKRSEGQLYEVLHFDPLTRLPNRQGLFDRIEHALLLGARNETSVALMLIDVDRFSTINDSLGIDTGDHVLAALAQRLQSCLRKGDTLARLGGDEFVILMEHVDSNAMEVEQLAETINASLGRPFEVGERTLYIEISMGITLFPQDGPDRATLLRNADTALNRAKAAGRNRWRFFDDWMAKNVERRLDIETALRRAVENGEFFLHFQPQCSMRSGAIVGVETLVRWSRPGVGSVPPVEFLPFAEESGLIMTLGRWILRAACHQAVAWREQQDFELRLAVNVAAAQIHQPDFVAQVREALAESGLSPGMLELEITESSILEDRADAIRKLHEVKALGVELAVDDFGTGYSSLAYLKELPIDRLKIDQSFVRDLPHDADNCAIVRTIIVMAHNLKMSVIAEGVESGEQLEFLRGEGCDDIQGFLFSPPVSPEVLLGRFGGRGGAREALAQRA